MSTATPDPSSSAPLVQERDQFGVGRLRRDGVAGPVAGVELGGCRRLGGDDGYRHGRGGHGGG
jgi:hypothetical protein